jgi:hypothetical protein
MCQTALTHLASEHKEREELNKQITELNNEIDNLNNE